MNKKLQEFKELKSNNKINRCGKCIFAQGGFEVQFPNGQINYKYQCMLVSRKDNIAYIDETKDTPVWENQRACKHFESIDKVLKKREDLDNDKLNSPWEGHYEIVPRQS